MAADKLVLSDRVVCCQVYLVSPYLSCSILFTWTDIEVESKGRRFRSTRFADNQKGLTMPLLDVQIDRQTVRQAIRKARRITSMLQGTMGLEGQGLDKQTLRRMKRLTVADLLQNLR
jgi:hypothetical protein